MLVQGLSLDNRHTVEAAQVDLTLVNYVSLGSLLTSYVTSAYLDDCPRYMKPLHFWTSLNLQVGHARYLIDIPGGCSTASSPRNTPS